MQAQQQVGLCSWGLGRRGFACDGEEGPHQMIVVKLWMESASRSEALSPGTEQIGLLIYRLTCGKP